MIKKEKIEVETTYGIRDDLYNFWFEEMDQIVNCSALSKGSMYQGKYHTKGKDPAMEKCFELLNASEEYNYLGEMFLIEYEYCMNSVENSTIKNLFNTVCLDIIAIRRMLIEYNLCCSGDQSKVSSTICSFKNFNKKFVNYNLTSLINFAKRSASTVHINFVNFSVKNFNFTILDRFFFIQIFALF